MAVLKVILQILVHIFAKQTLSYKGTTIFKKIVIIFKIFSNVEPQNDFLIQPCFC
jgi:hypothetical protein